MGQSWRFVLLAVGLPALLVAQECLDPCGMRGCCGKFEIFGEALYLQPTTCSFNYVVEDCDFCTRSPQGPFAVVPQGTQHGLCPEYDWGWRVGVGYMMNCDRHDIRAYYSRLCTRSTNKVDNIDDCAALWPSHGPSELLAFNESGEEAPDVFINGQFGNGICALAQNHVCVEWNAVDAELAARCACACDLWIRGHIGLEWTEICVRRNAHYEGSAPGATPILLGQNVFLDVHARSRTWGVGSRLGVDMRYDFLCGFGFGGHAGAGLFAGQTRHCSGAEVQVDAYELITEEEVLVIATQEQNVKNRSKCVVFPQFDAALGINYLWCCGSRLLLLFEVGYEWRTYLNTVDQSFYLNEDAEGAHAITCDHFAFSGLYIRGLIEF